MQLATGSLSGYRTEPSVHTILPDNGASLSSARRHEDSRLATAFNSLRLPTT